jgi:hypothetical protein
MGKNGISNRMNKSQPIHPAASFLWDRRSSPTEITQNRFDLKWVKNRSRVFPKAAQRGYAASFFLAALRFATCLHHLHSPSSRDDGCFSHFEHRTTSPSEYLDF